MLIFFLTIITGFVALSLVCSFILGVIEIRKRNKSDKEYRERDKEYKERVEKAMEDLKKLSN